MFQSAVIHVQKAEFFKAFVFSLTGNKVLHPKKMNEKEKCLCKQNSGIVLIDKLVVVYTGYLVYEIFEGPFWTEWLNEDHKVLINDKVKLHHREDVRMLQR